MKGVPYPKEDILKEARMLLGEHGSTHKVAKALGIAQSTVWGHLFYRLPGIDMALYSQVRDILRSNHTGGGR